MCNRKFGSRLDLAVLKAVMVNSQQQTGGKTEAVLINLAAWFEGYFLEGQNLEANLGHAVVAHKAILTPKKCP